MKLPQATQRLRFRLFEVEDAEKITEYVSPYEVASMTSNIPHPYNRKDALQWLSSLDDPVVQQNHVWAMETKSGDLIGSMGIFKREPELDWEIGYWIGKPHWGYGFPSEAANTATKWAIDELGARRIFASVMVENPASMRVLEKAGYKATGNLSSHFPAARNGEEVPSKDYLYTI